MKTLIKPNILWAVLAGIFVFTTKILASPENADSRNATPGEFNFQLPNEESTPQKTVKKITPKTSAKEKTINTPQNEASLSLREQIRLLNEKLDRLEAAQKQPVSTSASTAASTSSSPENSTNKAGYIHLPGTNTIFKIGGYVKVDGIYDANQYTGDSSNLPTLRLKGLEADANRSNVFTAHAKQTRLTLGSETLMPNGQIMAYLEGDFFGNSNTSSSSGTFSRSSTANSYNFRLQHAYGSYCYNNTDRIDIGQMWTLFYDPRSGGTTVEFNGPETVAQIRRPQIRYTHTRQAWQFAVSLESGATEYLDISPVFVGTGSLNAGSPSASYNSSQYRRAQSSFLGGITGDGNQALPDLVIFTQYEKKDKGHIILAGMARELRIKKVTTTGPNDPTFSGKKYGYGISLGGRAFIYGKSNLFAQMNFGKGIGTYIFALDGYGAALDVSRGLMQTQFAYGFFIGGEHYWNDHWRTNVIYSQACVTVADFIPRGRVSVTGLNAANNLTTLATTGYSISNMMRQFYVNLLWSPVEKFDIGIEYAHFRRDTINRYFGYGNRFQLGVYYKF